MSENKTGQPQASNETTESIKASIDLLDKMLAQEDPHFQSTIEALKNSGPIEADIQSLDVSIEDATEDADSAGVLGDTKNSSPQNNLKQTRVKKLWIQLKVRVIQYLKIKIKKARFFLFHLFRVSRLGCIDFAKYLILQIKNFFTATHSLIKKFFDLTHIQKGALLLSAALIVGACVVLFKTFTTQWVPQWQSPIIKNFTSVADMIYDTEKEFTTFSDAFPEVDFYLLLTKFIVNLKPSPGIPNPMGAFEFHLALDSNETAIEIKDREKEILDLTQRTVEEFTYNEINDLERRKRMLAKIKEAINDVLNQGVVRNVYVKTQITYRQ